ncbi:MAG: YadA-like family protein, partial [Dialister sp.]|nr:YadA-like family protein [Dialister sp.]
VADAVKTETDARTEADKALGEKITKNSQDIATLNGKVATAEGNITDLKAKDIDLEGKIQTNANNIQTNKNDITTIKQRTAGIDRIDATNETTIEGNVTVDNLGNVTAKGKLIGDGVDAGSLNVENASHLKGDVTMDNKLSVTGDTSLKKTDVDGALNAKDNVILGTNAANTVTVNGKSDFKAAVEMDKGLTVTNGDTSLKKTDVNGALSVTGESSLKNTTVGGTLDVTGATTLKGTLTAEKDATFEKNVTVEKDLTVNGKLNVGEIYMKNDTHESTGKTHDSATAITADGISNRAKVTDENGNTTESKFTHNEKGTFNYAKDEKITGEWKGATSNVTADGVSNKMTDSAGNTHTYYQTAAETKEQLVNGNKSNFEKKTAKGNTVSITEKDAAGNPKSSLTNTQTVDGEKTSVTNKDSSSTINQGADQIRYNVTSKDENKTSSSIEVKADGITNTSKDGTITNDANHIENTANTMNTTVTGQATESYGKLDTTVNGEEKHTVNGKQTNTVKEGQINNITGGQTNTITGGQINNITGDQTTTITGNKNETVTENVKEDYKKDLTTTVGGNETHEVKGTKTETVEGKVTENYKAGQATNVTGDQDITVSGTQTTKATDIKRNASSGMIDTIDNDYGTNTETKVAGETKTEVSIKGTGEKGEYIRGATESRDYIINGTLENKETKTAEATTSKVTDGTLKNTEMKTAKETSSEVTDGNGKTSATIQDVTQISGSVTDGTNTSVSNVKANSIDSIVTGEGMSSVINQKKGSIQSTVVDGTSSTVILQDKDNVTIASSNGMVGIVGKDIVNNAQNTITNTAGTKITDKVGTNTRVIDSTSITDTVGTANRKIEDGKITDTAGDFTVTTENGNGTTFAKKTGSTAYSTEVGAPTDTNIAGNHITTGRVDANELGVSDKDGDNTADLSVKAGEGVKASAGNGTTTGSLDVKADKVTTSIKSGSKENTVISTADGTSFSNSKANTAFEGGTYTDTTIKGNTITTGKVTMDYAEVMKDLGVNRNANIGGKTTTGSLEVKGESKLTGNVTMENNATVGNDLIVKGITTTKTLKVTENAEIDGNATIKGDVTARSYKVGDKTYIDANGIHANNQKITNVADGSISEGSKDAVNGGQLYGVKRDLEHQVDKVGANAAAIANLRPMEFDPSSKWNIAAAIGNYGSETAAALGAFYRPNDDVMVNLSTAFGTGENMVGGGVSVRLGKGGNKLSREENNALKDQVNDLTARMDALLSVLNPNMSKDFPDVPENHWAYEAVSRLAGNDIVQGYPDGEFHGERTMTRYEMAEIIYNALSRGAEAERELVEEFKPELQAMAASEKATAEKAEG